VIVTYIYADTLADQIRIQVRCKNMADAINRTGAHRANLLDMTSFVQNTAQAKKVCGESDLLIVYRYLYGSILTAIQYWKARDKKIIVDFDQAFNYLNENKPGYSFWYEGILLADLDIDGSSIIDPPPIEQFKWGLAMVDAATVSSVRLVDDWSRFTTVHKVLDYINTHHYPTSQQEHGDEIWIGPGSRVDYDCFEKSGLLAAMENICCKYPRVRLVLPGMGKESLAMNINPKQLKICPPSRFEDWVDILLSLDIGLMPISGEYDLRLGSYDLLEFMISKIPWIASEESTFRNLSQYGQWVPNTSFAWENTILDTMEKLDAHQRNAVREPFLFALNQDVSVNIARILKTYEVIIKH
jgi:hypothetical protein